MTTKVIMTDGTQTTTLYRVKGINPYTDETPGVWTPEYAKDAGARSARLVPSVFSGVSTRMQTTADLPFTIYGKGDKAVDDSDDYKNTLGFMPYPARFLALTEGALVTSGAAYWFQQSGARTKAVKGLQYWIPSSVQLDPDSAKQGIIKFKRHGVNQLFAEDHVLYTWLLDPDVELGPPSIYPLKSALTAAEANGAITGWVRDYMLRGAIKAMLLMVDGTPPDGEVERIENWFNRFMSGAKGLMWKVFNMAGIKPTVIGDGLEAMKDLSVSKELRYEIHQALGTRHLLEDENYATAGARERQFYTQTIVPDARLIQASLNEQILHKMGYHWEFEPERLELFQQNEAAWADSLQKLYTMFVGSMEPATALKLAMDILDYELTQDQENMIANGLKKQQSEPQPPPAQEQQPPNKSLVELERWQQKVDKAGKMITWHPVDIPADMAKDITSGALSFGDARLQLVGPQKGAAEILEGIRLGLQALETKESK